MALQLFTLRGFFVVTWLEFEASRIGAVDVFPLRGHPHDRPHLLSDAEIARAFASFHRTLKPGGWMVISVRDYASIERNSPDVRPYGPRCDGDRHFLEVQVWDWDADQYDLRLYLTTESSGACETRVLTTRYYAVSIQRLIQLMSAAGFADVQRRDDALFQPVLIGRRASTIGESQLRR